MPCLPCSSVSTGKSSRGSLPSISRTILLRLIRMWITTERFSNLQRSILWWIQNTSKERSSTSTATLQCTTFSTTSTALPSSTWDSLPPFLIKMQLNDLIGRTPWKCPAPHRRPSLLRSCKMSSSRSGVQNLHSNPDLAGYYHTLKRITR